MVLRGKVQNGVVVLQPGAAVPDGAEVSVFLPDRTVDSRRLADESAQRRAALAELLALPDENPADTFSGADHDKVLYGEPE